MIHHSDDWLTIHQGDAATVLATLPADSVDCIVTSPPYWGLRDYGTATWIGGDEGCDHRSPTMREGRNEDRAKLAGSESTNGAQLLLAARTGCGKCGATRQDSQLGLEATPEQYVANLVGVFRELRRVLKPSGTCWLNLGDTYHGGGGGNYGSGISTASDHGQHLTNVRNRIDLPGLKPKDLVGIPWRVAFALQADGWWLRSDIIWSKPNPMPESVTDRPTKAHEYLFLLTKSARYYFDQEAVAERSVTDTWSFGNNGPSGELVIPNQGYAQHRPSRKRGEFNGKTEAMPGRNAFRAITATRNLRSVWTIATRPYPGAHFAVFPPELPERCIKAGSSERGVCPECGAPWERVVSVMRGERDDAGRTHSLKEQRNGKSPVPERGWETDRTTLGWAPACACVPVVLDQSVRQVPGRPQDHGDRLTVPAVVLDPFAGSGTVGLVANRLSRRAILIDLNPAYLEQQMKRNAQTVVGL